MLKCHTFFSQLTEIDKVHFWFDESFSYKKILNLSLANETSCNETSFISTLKTIQHCSPMMTKHKKLLIYSRKKQK